MTAQGTIMKLLINKTLLTGYLQPTWYGPWFAPYFAVTLKYLRLTADRSSLPWGRWIWEDARAVEECLASTWNMLGAWNARRAVPIDRGEFDAAVPAPVQRLARCLNRHGLESLRDLGQLDNPTYSKVMSEIVDVVLELSQIKQTSRTEPMFGSKTAHHFFPSIVPVFDSAMVRKGLLQTSAYRDFLQADHGGWFPTRVDDAGREFAGYLAFLTAQVSETHLADLETVREAFGEAVRYCAPKAMADDRRSVLWRLDAKLAEACALGEARREGLLDEPTWMGEGRS